MISKVGILAGTFDPVHEGHIAFAQAAIKQCNLDKVFLLVEPNPRHKQGVKALIHREAMVRLAIAHHRNLGTIQLEQANFSVAETLPTLQELFKGAELYMLFGEDVLTHLASWPHVDDLLHDCGLIIGARENHLEEVQAQVREVQEARNMSLDVDFLVTPEQAVASSKIKRQLQRGKTPPEIDPEVMRYINKHNLYASQESA